MARKLFDELEPPPGGLVRLRARLREDQRRSARSRLLWPALAGACAASIVAAVLAQRAPAPAVPWGAPGLAAGAAGDATVAALPGSGTAVERLAGGEVPVFRVAALAERSP